tara:strand:- start:6610 stop:7113 length:504 start_codon:yes stop_codon:yes gene_type:complete
MRVISYKERMIKKKHIFYCEDCGDKEAIKFCKEHGIELESNSFDGKARPIIFTDLKGFDKEALNDVLAYVKDGVVVVVRKLSDFGTGAKSREIQNQIKAKGGEVLVPEKVLQKRGPKFKGEIPADRVEWAKALYNNKANSRQFVCDAIHEKTGVKLTRHQLKKRFEP